MFAKSTFASAFLVAMVAAQSSAPAEPALSLNFPPSRGNAPETANIAPCGGWQMGGRIDYPLSGRDFSMTAVRDCSSIQFAYSTVGNPSALTDFTDVNGVGLNQIYGGSGCINGIDFGSLGVATGSNVTMVMKYRSGPQRTEMYECADFTIVADAEYAPLNYTCTNTQLTTQNKRISASNPQLFQIQSAATAEAAETHAQAYAEAFWKYQPSGLSLAGAGGIGAAVALATVFLVLLAGWATGAVAFGKRKLTQNREQSHYQETKSVASSA